MPPLTQLPPSLPSDSTLPPIVARARAGDVSALGELYGRYARMLLALARRLLGSAEDAEDVLHDVFLGLPEALRQYEERGSLESWLKRLTARVALNRLRSHGRRREIALDGALSTRRGGADAVHDAIALQAAIDDLSDALRAVFVLKEIEGFSHAEIGALLQITPGASEVRLHRAIRSLRHSLDPNR